MTFKPYPSKYTPRQSAWNALKAISAIIDKCPNDAVPNIAALSEEDKAFLQMRIINLRESLRNVPKHFSFFEPLRKTRNRIGHSEKPFDDVELSTLCSYVLKKRTKIQADLKKYIEKTFSKGKTAKFEKKASPSFGTAFDRKKLVDAMDAFFPEKESDGQKIDFPENRFSSLAKEMLESVYANNSIREYGKSHNGIVKNIQSDILEWLQKMNSTLVQENPFVEEAAFIQETKNRSAEEIAEDVSKIEFHYRRLSSVSPSKRGAIADSTVDFDFYKKKFDELKQNAAGANGIETTWDSPDKKANEDKASREKAAASIKILARNLIKEMEDNLIDRKNKWEQELIEKLRRQFLEELYRKIENFIKLETLVTPFINDLGYLWDLSNRPFQDCGFEVLNQFAKLLEQDESLRELAELLGKQSRAKSTFEKELRDKVVIKTEWHPQPAYRGQISGLAYSNDIASVLPSELALLENPRTRKLFELKFAQKQLLSFKFESRVSEEKSETEQEEISVEKKEPKGLIIVCVDTSGSMHGTPENIAKTVTFSLSKIAIEEERKCYLISFSTGIKTLDLSSFSEGKPIEKLVGFLKMSFNGGTDANPALSHAVKMLSQNDWKNADVLMISDFVMGNLGDDLVKSIEAEKEKNTCFYSLVIGDSGNKNAIACFNHNWLYNITDPHASRHLVEQLHELKGRNIKGA